MGIEINRKSSVFTVFIDDIKINFEKFCAVNPEWPTFFKSKIKKNHRSNMSTDVYFKNLYSHNSNFLELEFVFQSRSARVTKVQRYYLLSMKVKLGLLIIYSNNENYSYNESFLSRHFPGTSSRDTPFRVSWLCVNLFQCLRILLQSYLDPPSCTSPSPLPTRLSPFP